MHDDLIDAVDWAVKEGYADRDRVAIFGGSYGGYATLVGVTFTPTCSPRPSTTRDLEPRELHADATCDRKAVPGQQLASVRR